VHLRDSVYLLALGLAGCATSAPSIEAQAIDRASEFLLAIGEPPSRIYPIEIRRRPRIRSLELTSLGAAIEIDARGYVSFFSRITGYCGGGGRPTSDLGALERRARATIEAVYPGFHARRFKLQPVRTVACTSYFEYDVSPSPGLVSVGLRADTGELNTYVRSALPLGRTTPIRISEREARRIVETRRCGSTGSICTARLVEMLLPDRTRSMTVWWIDVYRKRDRGSDIVTCEESHRINADTKHEVDEDGGPVRRAWLK
jgi:hypothetical protein